MTAKLRLLYLPNEPHIGWQTGPRRCFEAMAADGGLGDYLAYSFLCEAETRGSDRAALDRLHDIAREFRPDIVLWQHISHFNATRDDFVKLKQLSSRPTLVWCRTPDAMLDVVDYYLGRPREDLIELGRLGRDYARKHLTADTILRNLIKQAADLRRTATVGNEGRCNA